MAMLLTSFVGFVFFLIAVSTASAPVGLINRRNACFANSMMQALFHIPSFRQAVANSKNDPTKRAPIPELQEKLITAFEKMAAKAQSPEDIYDLYDALRPENIDVNIQNDGKHVLSCLLNQAIHGSIKQNLFQYSGHFDYLYQGVYYPFKEYTSNLPVHTFPLLNADDLLATINQAIPEEKKRGFSYKRINSARMASGQGMINADVKNGIETRRVIQPNKILVVGIEASPQNRPILKVSPALHKITVGDKQYHLISAIIFRYQHYWTIVKTDPLNNTGWYKLSDSQVNSIDEAGVMNELQHSRYLIYVEEDEMNSWEAKALAPPKRLLTNIQNPPAPSNVANNAAGGNSGSTAGANVGPSPGASTGSTSGSGGASSSSGSSGSSSSGSGGSSSSSSGSSPSGSGGGSSSGSSVGSSGSSGSSKSNSSSRTTPVSSKTIQNKTSSSVSRPIYKSSVFWVCSAGVVVSVTLLAAFVLIRARS